MLTLLQGGLKTSSLAILFQCPQAASVFITKLSLNILSWEWHVSNCGLCWAFKQLQKESFQGISVGQQMWCVYILNATCFWFVNMTSVLPLTAFHMCSGLVWAVVYRWFTLVGHGTKWCTNSFHSVQWLAFQYVPVFQKVSVHVQLLDEKASITG